MLNFAAAWPTVVYARTVTMDDVMRTRLNELVMTRLQDVPEGLEQQAGKRTMPNILTIEGEEVSWLKSLIYESVRILYKTLGHSCSGPITAEAWGVHTYEGAYHQPHTHHGSAWSGVLFLDYSSSSRSDQYTSGMLHLHDPRLMLGGGMTQEPQAYAIPATPGRLVVFPSWLIHSVTRLRAGQSSTLIAFNAR